MPKFKMIISPIGSNDILVECEKQLDDCIQSFSFIIDTAHNKSLSDILILSLRASLISKVTDLTERLFETALLTGELKTEKL